MAETTPGRSVVRVRFNEGTDRPKLDHLLGHCRVGELVESVDSENRSDRRPVGFTAAAERPTVLGRDGLPQIAVSLQSNKQLHCLKAHLSDGFPHRSLRVVKRLWFARGFLDRLLQFGGDGVDLAERLIDGILGRIGFALVQWG